MLLIGCVTMGSCWLHNGSWLWLALPAGRPGVLRTTPADGALDVPLGTYIVVTFNRMMDSKTLNGQTILINGQPLEQIPGAEVRVPDPEGRQAVILVRLAKNQLVTITLAREIKDAQGQALEKPYVWRFTTGAKARRSAVGPTVLGRYPRKYARGVPTDAPITLRWDEDIDATTLGPDAVELVPASGGKPLPLVVALYGTRTVFRPSQPLTPNTTYDVRVTSKIRNQDGLAPERLAKWTFTTGGGPAKGLIIADTWTHTHASDGTNYDAILSAAVENTTSPARKVRVTALIQALGRTIELYDSGDLDAHGDKVKGDGLYSNRFLFPADAKGGEYMVTFTATTADEAKLAERRNAEPAHAEMYLIPRPTPDK